MRQNRSCHGIKSLQSRAWAECSKSLSSEAAGGEETASVPIYTRPPHARQDALLPRGYVEDFFSPSWTLSQHPAFYYQRISADAHVSPAPNAPIITRLPSLIRPAFTASSSANGIDAADVLPYR